MKMDSIRVISEYFLEHLPVVGPLRFTITGGFNLDGRWENQSSCPATPPRQYRGMIVGLSKHFLTRLMLKLQPTRPVLPKRGASRKPLIENIFFKTIIDSQQFKLE
ncbi:unnamed protein product [Sphenostylis stenocarpa]|uniref:Uncharacterized protein n=1 Tax=Sphenostylis stenocarpa TaxID=92480 RepID=A0AA87B9L1_9FABA|nr:unnamed protein product [Sphenostylis stenocarpa]